MKTSPQSEFTPPPHSENGRIFHDDIAFAAFCLWEQEGRPQDRDLAHWYRAEKLLRDAHKGISFGSHT